MASLTAKTSRVRRHKMSTRGKLRKRALRIKGSTPKFPIHKPASKE